LLERFQVPVVPVFIRGTEAMPPGKALPKFQRVTILFGEAVQVADLLGQGEEDSSRRIAQSLYQRVASLGDHLQASI
jgi:1-acyl-sn-glycerol-3-phosphate acyltransferase